MAKKKSILRENFRQEAVAFCQEKIAHIGENVGMLFETFFSNKNDDPELLMDVVVRWIKNPPARPF